MIEKDAIIFILQEKNVTPFGYIRQEADPLQNSNEHFLEYIIADRYFIKSIENSSSLEQI